MSQRTTGKVVAVALFTVLLLSARNAQSFFFVPGLISLAAPAQTPNEFAVGSALDTVRFNTLSGLAPQIAQLALMSNEGEARSLADIAPVQYAALPSMEEAVSHGLIMGVRRRLSMLRNDEILTPPAIEDPNVAGLMTRNLLASNGPASLGSSIDPMIAARWGFWSSVHHTDQRVDTFDAASGTQPGMSSHGIAVSFGAERRLTEYLIAGVGGSYSKIHANIAEGLGRSDATSLLGGVYGSIYQGALHADLYAGAGQTAFDLRRMIPSLGGEASGSPNGTQADARIAVGVDAPLSGIIAGTSAALEYHHLGIGAFTETGAGALNYAVDRQVAESISSSLGVKASVPSTWRGIQWEPSASAAWRHEFHNRNRVVNAAFDSGAGPRFAVAASEVGRNAADLSLRLDAKFSETFSCFAEAAAEVGLAHSRQDSWGAGGKIRF